MELRGFEKRLEASSSDLPPLPFDPDLVVVQTAPPRSL